MSSDRVLGLPFIWLITDVSVNFGSSLIFILQWNDFGSIVVSWLTVKWAFSSSRKSGQIVYQELGEVFYLGLRFLLWFMLDLFTSKYRYCDGLLPEVGYNTLSEGFQDRVKVVGNRQNARL